MKTDRLKMSRRRGYCNILFMGCDVHEDIYVTRDATEREKWMRSDVMLVLSMNRSTEEIKLLTLERDAWVNIPGHGMDKLNAAVVYGGPRSAMKVVNDAYHLNISKYAMINMSNMVELIDSLGGIDMYLTDEDAEWIDDTICAARFAADKWETEVPRLGKGGLCHLNGLQAIQLMRNRYRGSRNDRVENVLKAMIYKGKKEYNYLGIIVTALRSMKYIKTNVGIPLGLRLLDRGRKVKLKDLEAYVVPCKGTYEIRRDGPWRLEVDFERASEEMWDYLTSGENE